MNVHHVETWSMSEYRIFMTCLWLSMACLLFQALLWNFGLKKNLQIQVLHHTCTPNLVNLLNATLCCVWCAGIKESDTGLAPPALWDLAADKQTLQSEWQLLQSPAVSTGHLQAFVHDTLLGGHTRNYIIQFPCILMQSAFKRFASPLGSCKFPISKGDFFEFMKLFHLQRNVRTASLVVQLSSL